MSPRIDPLNCSSTSIFDFSACFPPNNSLVWGLVNFSYKGSESKDFKFCRSHSLQKGKNNSSAQECPDRGGAHGTGCFLKGGWALVLCHICFSVSPCTEKPPVGGVPSAFGTVFLHHLPPLQIKGFSIIITCHGQ